MSTEVTGGKQPSRAPQSKPEHDGPEAEQPSAPKLGRSPAGPRLSIDRAVPIPYYYQLERILRAEVASGSWVGGQPILSERQLCDLYSVSRTTVRQVIARLIQDGLLYHVKGKGTFVTPGGGRGHSPNER